MVILATTLPFTKSFPLCRACLTLTPVLFRGHSSEKGCYLPRGKEVKNQGRSPGLALYSAVSTGSQGWPQEPEEPPRQGTGCPPLEQPGWRWLRGALW